MILNFVLVAIIAFTFIGCEEQDMLPLRFETGDQFRQKVKLESKMQMLFPNADDQESEMVLSYLVEEVDDESTAQIKVTIDTIKVQMQSLTIQCSFDSSKAEPEGKETTDMKKLTHQQRYESSFSGLTGKSYRVRVDRSGKVLELFDVDKRIDQISTGQIKDGNFGGNQAAMLFSQHNLREYTAVGIIGDFDLSKDDWKQGWTSYQPIETPQTLPVMAQKQVQVKEISQNQGETIAQLEFSIASAEDIPMVDYATIKRGQSNMSFKVVPATAGGMGAARFSLTRGRMLEYNERNSVEVMLSQGIKSRSGNKDSKKKIYYKVYKTIENMEN